MRIEERASGCRTRPTHHPGLFEFRIGGVEMLEASGDRSSPPFTNFDTSGVFSLYLLSCFPACRKEDSHVRIVCAKKSFSGE